MKPRVAVQLADAPELERQRSELALGSVLAPGVCGVAPGTECELTLVFPAQERLTVTATAVLVQPDGTAFVFRPLEPAMLARLTEGAAKVAAAREAPEAEQSVKPGEAAGAGGEARAVAGAGAAAGEGAPPEGAATAGDEPAGRPARTEAPPRHLHERLRGLNVVEQLRVAREGDVSERTVLERIYGKTVWEALLRNSRLTVAEVARLAKMGTMPRPLLETILANGAWLQAAQVRRALLANPRLSSEMAHRVLELMPKAELKLVPQQTAYPSAVRMAAKRMLKPGS